MRGAAGIDLGTMIKHLRRTSSGATGNGPGATMKCFSLFAFRLVLPEHNLKRALWTCAEVAPLSLLVGVLIHSGRRFLSLSLFLSFLSLSTILICFSFSRFLYAAGRSLSALGRLVAALLSANAAMHARLCRDARATHARDRIPKHEAWELVSQCL